MGGASGGGLLATGDEGLNGAGEALLGDLVPPDDFLPDAILCDLLLIGECPLAWYYDLAAGIGYGFKV